MEPNVDKAKGRIKQAAGDLTDDPELRNEGKADEAGGRAKSFIEDAKDKLEEGVDKVKEMFRKH